MMILARVVWITVLFGFTLPYTPLHLPPEELWQSDHSELDPAADPAENPLPYFHAMIEAMDSEIGRLLASIDPAVLDNTYVIFLGDNGTPGATVTEPFRPGRAKASVYQGGVNVPLIVKGPRAASGYTLMSFSGTLPASKVLIMRCAMRGTNS